MNKKILYLAIAILIASQAFSQDVSVTTNMPASAEPGGEFTVEVIINKGSTAGFGKLQQDLPPGFTATAIDAKGGNFSFREQAVKIIWMSLPPGAEYTASYKVAVASDVSGDQTIAGKFQYLKDNQRTAINIDPTTISIGAAPVVALAEPEPTVDLEGERRRKEQEARAEEDRKRKEKEDRFAEFQRSNKSSQATSTPPPSASYKKPAAASSKFASPSPYKYLIQIAASRHPLPNNDSRLSKVDKNLTSRKGSDGWHRYFAGAYKYLRPAKERLAELKAKGVTDAWLNIYHGGISGYGNSSGIVYKIQIGAYKFPIPESNLNLLGLDGITSRKDPDGYYRYFAGTYLNRRAAKARLKEVMAKGVTDAWIAKY
ncbi:MAG: hypothetical protein FVQ77_05045 [Cytophagales bacterium]|nr:hypothetical protein [Cytophagales bacterium]